MSIEQFRDDLTEEVATILSSGFRINITKTQAVPHFGDSSITFPNLDAMTQGCKFIETAVLYIDIRRSTDLNLTHHPQTVAKLYSAFVRAMTRCARRNGGHVRGIIGDRVMVLFDSDNPFVNAVETAISMNSVSQYVINKHFKSNEVACGIGIDCGKMLATKTGFRRHGNEQQNYRSLVWLGRPANVASKLTDIANKKGETVTVTAVSVARDYSGLGSWHWSDEWWVHFIKGFERDYQKGGWKHNDPSVVAFITKDVSVTVQPKTPSILMTKAVFDGYKAARPNAPAVVNKWLDKIAATVPGYNGEVYGGDVIWSSFLES